MSAMALRPCIETGCPALTSRTRCTQHERARDRSRGTPAQRGYDAAWVARSREQRRRVPYCEECGDTDDLTADHIIPGDANSPIRTLCRSCNSARANRGRARARPRS